MMTKVIQVTTVGEGSNMVGKEVTCIDKDSEAYIEYFLHLKQYMTDLTKFNLDLETYFSIIIGQCSPVMEQSFAGEKEFKNIKETSETIDLIKTTERIYYNYQSHKCGPLGGCESLDRLGTTRQPEDTYETEHHDKFKTVIKVCKASKINFSLMCTANIDMTMKELWESGKVTK